MGDQLIALDGQLIKSSEELQKKLSESKPTVVATFHHALFSYCEFSGSTVERLQLDKEVFRSTGRAAEIFTVCLNVPKVLDESKYSLRFTVRYDARERVQIAQLDPSGLAAIHLRVGDVIRDVNDHPIASKAMLRYYMSEAVCTGQTILLGVERLVNGDEALRDMVEASSDVLEIAQKQVRDNIDNLYNIINMKCLLFCFSSMNSATRIERWRPKCCCPAAERSHPRGRLV